MVCRSSRLRVLAVRYISIATLVTVLYFLIMQSTPQLDCRFKRTSDLNPTQGCSCNCDRKSPHIPPPIIVTLTGDPNYFSTEVLTKKTFKSAYVGGGSEIGTVWSMEAARFHPPLYIHSNKTQRSQVFQESTGPYNRFGLIRDPVDRFVSGYLHICVNSSSCWDCEQPDSPAGLRCFIERQFEGMKQLSRNNLNRSWFCGFDVLNYTKIFQLTPDGIDQMKKTLVNVGWPSDQIYSGWGEQRDAEFMAQKPPHNTETARQTSRFGQEQIIELLSSNRTLAEYFARVYYSDYVNVNFNFTRPHWFDRQCEDCGAPCSDWAICYLAGRSTRCKIDTVY